MFEDRPAISRLTKNAHQIAAGHLFDQTGHGDEGQAVVAGGADRESFFHARGHGKQRGDDGEARQNSGEHVAEAVDRGGQRHVRAGFGEDSERDAQAPAGSCGPDRLRQCFKPGLVVEKVTELEAKVVVETFCRAREHQRTHGHDDQADEQDGDEDLVGFFNAGNALVTDIGGNTEDQNEQDDCYDVAVRDGSKQRSLVRAVIALREGQTDVIDNPSEDGGIVRGGHRHDECDDRAEPGRFFSGDQLERAGSTAAAAAAHEVLAHHNRDDDDEHHDDVREDERTAVGGCDAREAPDVARSDRTGDQGNNECKLGRIAKLPGFRGLQRVFGHGWFSFLIFPFLWIRFAGLRSHSLLYCRTGGHSEAHSCTYTSHARISSSTGQYSSVPCAWQFESPGPSTMVGMPSSPAVATASVV